MNSLEILIQQALIPSDLEALLPAFSTYLTLLRKWNKTYNLTAIREEEAIINKHLIDSLAIRPWLKGTHILDVGTGAGFPGIPIAIAMPDLKVTLLDSNGKKINFLREVKRTLCLSNVEIVESRIEAYQPPLSFDTVTSRAFATIEQMIDWTKHLIAQNGIWLAMKGHYPQVEVQNLPYPWRVETYQLPNNVGERCCVIIENKNKE